MTLPVKYFNSAMPGAPALTGQAGSGINVLDFFLKDGGNSKTVTSITRSGSTATATVTGHGYTVTGTPPIPITLLFAGATQSEYNGDQVVTIIDANTMTFPVTGTPASPATTSSSITCKISPLGWTKAFSGTNVASYKMPAGSSGAYLGVDDNQSSGSQYWMRVRGFETMSAAGVAVASGTGPNPTDVQVSGGNYWIKSITQDGTPRQWRACGDANFFWIHILTDSTVARSVLYWSGDPIAIKSGDSNPACLLGSSTGTVGSATSPAGPFASNVSSASPGLFFSRSFTGLGGSVSGGIIGDNAVSSNWGAGGFTFPNGEDNGCHLSAIRLNEPGTTSFRAILPGLYQPLHNKPQSDGDTLNNITNLPGITALFMAGGLGGTETYRYVADITGPWR